MKNKKKQKKVLFFVPSNVGGAERMTVNIAKMLPADEFEVKFVVIGRSLGTIVHFIPKQFEVSHISIANIYCFTTIRMTWKIYMEKPDIVFSSLYYLNARLILAAKSLGVKVIVRSNSGLSNSKKSVVKFVKLTYGMADRIICQQEEMRDEILSLIKITPDKVKVLKNPIDTDKINECLQASSPYPEEASSQIKYVSVARFSKDKAQDTLVKVFANIRKKIFNAHLYLVGLYDKHVSYDASVIDYIEANGLNDCIHLIGFETNPYKWIKNADCFVLSSRTEGLPNSLIEAMYLGVPVVATRCIPVIERIVKDGYNGYLTDVDDIVSMEKSMLKAIKLHDFKNTYIPATKEDFIQIFRECIN